MKKKNLNWLLALLAALALVFAGACSDGSDDTSSGNTDQGSGDEDAFKLSSVIAGTEWEYSSGMTSGEGVYGVTIKFGDYDNGGNVTLTAYGNNGTNDVGSSGSGVVPCYGYQASATVTYTVDDTANTVTITSSTCSSKEIGSGVDESAVITLKLDDSSISAKALSDSTDSESTLTVSSITVGNTGSTAALTVGNVAGYLLDILKSGTSGALTATSPASVFKCTDDGVTE